MIQKTLQLIAAPTGMQPGGYVPKAYGKREGARTPTASLEIDRSARGWRFRAVWPCPDPVRKISNQTDTFPDAAAIVAPEVRDAPWVTMGAPGQAVGGYLWRADRESLLRVDAEGLGSVLRAPTDSIRHLNSRWKSGEWSLVFEVADWPDLDVTHQVALAIWRGAERERAGLKSISLGWIEVEA